MNITDFYNSHKGETALLIGNGPNLELTPPELFDYPCFGMNTFFKREGGRKPDFYVAVDEIFFDQFEDEVRQAYLGIPKFFPAEFVERWNIDNKYGVAHRRDSDVVRGQMLANRRESLVKGINWKNVMHLAMQLGWYMGFKTLLMIGVQQKPGVGSLREHFWGIDEMTPVSQNDDHWNEGYKALVSTMTDVKVLNISEDTYVPEDVLPRDDWKNWTNK